LRQLSLIASTLLLAASTRQEAPRSPGLFVRATLSEPSEVADWRVVDLDGRPGSELFAVLVDGTIETVRFDADASKPPQRGAGKLADPRHCAIALAALSGEGPPDLLIASPRGVERVKALAGGVFSGEPRLLAPRARMRLRTGRPRFAPFVQDVNGDGRADLVVPDGEALDVWIQGVATGADQEPTFSKVASVKVRVGSSRSTDASLLSDDLESSLSIPGLSMADVNGDGRPDLLVEDGEKRAFHLVREGGAISAQPDVQVDLGIFRDTTPRADLVPGRTLAGSDQPVFVSRDLDSDGIPDYVIAHRRKVWVFHGTKDGPQFTKPSTILKAADDVTALLVLDLDQDKKPDLLLIKVQVPSIASILRGLVATWSVDVEAIGYRNDGQGGFETTPKWRNTLSFEVPSILSILKDPDKIVKRFEGVGKKFRQPCEGDFDGDGVQDLAFVSEDGQRLEVWRGQRDLEKEALEPVETVIRRVLFEDENSTWDLDRLLQWMSTAGDRKISILTGGREPAAKFALRDRSAWRLEELAAADVDGDGHAEIVLRYSAVGASRTSSFDVLSWR
jgi:FG-GAP-like repeat